MARHSLPVPDMADENDERDVENAVKAVRGALTVEADHANQSVEFIADPDTYPDAATAVRELGFTVDD